MVATGAAVAGAGAGTGTYLTSVTVTLKKSIGRDVLKNVNFGSDSRSSSLHCRRRILLTIDSVATFVR